MNQASFSMFIQNTISNNISHFILIILDFLLLLFPSIFHAILKLKLYDSSIDFYFQSVDTLQYLPIFQYFHRSLIVSIVFASVSLLLLIIYALMLWTSPSLNKMPAVFQRITAFIYDIVLFRYCSIVFFEASLHLMFYFVSQGGLGNSILSVLFLLLFLALVVAAYQHIKLCAIVFSISNPSLVRETKIYPYDLISKQLDIPQLIVKAFIAFEYNCFQYIQSIDTIIFALNVSIVIISVIAFVRLFFAKLLVSLNLTIFYANVQLNYLRKGISAFTFLVCFFGVILLMFNSDPMKGIIYAVIVSLNVTLCVIISESLYLNSSFVERHLLSYKVLLLTLIYGDKQNATVIRKLLNGCYFNHQFDCKLTSCTVCLQYGGNMGENFKLFYKFLKANSKPTTFDEEVVKLFYYKISKKTFKFFLYYHTLLNKYEAHGLEYVRNLRLIVESWLLKEFNDQNEIILHLIDIRNLELRVKKLLVDMNDFFQSPLVLKSPEAMVNLSTEINTQMQQLMQFVKQSNYQKSAYFHGDSNSKVIHNIFHYNVLMLRFIFECLINRQLDDLNPLVIEMYEEYLNHHYHFDQVIICMVDLSSTVFHRLKLLKVTGLLSHKNHSSYLCDYFPKEIKANGVKMMYDALETQKTATEKKLFIYPYLSLGVLHYIKYSFSLLELIDRDQLILYGQYHKENKMHLLLRTEQQSQIFIIGFCREILQLIFLKPEWFEYLEEVNIPFNIKMLFKGIQINEQSKQIECELDFDYFISKAEYIIAQLQSIIKFNAKPKNEDKVKAMKRALNQQSGVSYKVVLDQVTSYSNGISLYQVTIKNYQMETVNQDKEESVKNWNNNNYEDFHTYSNSSVSQDKQIRSTNISNKFKLDNYQNLNIAEKNKIRKTTTTLSIYSISMIGLNVILIIICIVFLITQISQTQVLVNMTSFYFKFKTVRIVFVSFLFTIISTICIARNSSQVDNCESGYSKYNDYFRERYGLGENFVFVDYLGKELKLKSDFVMGLLNEFKGIVYQYRNLDLELVLNYPMLYWIFEDRDDQLLLRQETLSFEEGFRTFSNRINVITQAPVPYSTVPIYFTSYINGNYSFENVPNGKLSLIQKEIYLSIFNYIYFFAGFTHGEDLVRSKIFGLKYSNEIFNYAFMISLGVLNLLLLFICYKNVQTAFNLFKMIIVNTIYKIEEKECSKTLKEKIANLITLVSLYKKNPNHIIKKLCAHESWTRQTDKAIAQGKTIEGSAKPIEVESNQLKPPISFGHNFKGVLLMKLIVVYVTCFAVYFLIIIVYDAVLITQYQQVFNQFDYLYFEFDFENQVYITIGFTMLTVFSNYTSETFGAIINKTSPPDGIFNDYLRKNSNNLKGISTYLSTGSSLYPPLSGYFSQYTCECIFMEHDDFYLITISKDLGADYRLVSIMLCEKFNLLNQPNFEYLRNDLLQRSALLVNNAPNNDYNSKYLFTTSFEFYEVCTIALFTLRVLYKTFRDMVLLPAITASFLFYVTLVGIYLCVNIIAEILIFIVVKWFIIKKLNDIQNNLNLFNNCLN